MKSPYKVGYDCGWWQGCVVGAVATGAVWFFAWWVMR
jgi:hypothetical protein